jgi:hypothetical protein
VGEAGALDGVKGKNGKARLGLKKCYACRQQFTVRVGTVFESAHIPLHKMLQAVYLLSSSKKGISAHQIHRALEITYKSAWFLCHRVREAMREGNVPPLGGEGKTVEIDETYVGGLQKNKHKHKREGGTGGVAKEIAFALVERNGKVRTQHITEGAKALLAARRKPLNNVDIVAAFKVGGLHMNSVDPVNTVGSVLTRRFNLNGDIVRVGRGTWGLKEWYPNRNFKKADKAEPDAEASVEPEAELDTVDGGPSKIRVRERVRHSRG